MGENVNVQFVTPYLAIINGMIKEGEKKCFGFSCNFAFIRAVNQFCWIISFCFNSIPVFPIFSLLHQGYFPWGQVTGHFIYLFDDEGIHVSVVLT